MRAMSAAMLVIALAQAGLRVARAQDSGEFADSGWALDGANTLRFDHYDVSGPAAQGPYPFDGPKAYDEFGLNLRRQDREFARWRAQVYGALNANQYRSPDDYLVPERLNLTREVGDAAVPYRWELGDYFSYLSYMTQQRSLKGVQIELQPRFGERVDSFVVFAGANESQWQDLTFGDDYSTGASYLLDSRTLGSWSFNAVYNHRTGRARFGQLDREQVVASATVERSFALAGQQLTFEGEYAHFTGDHDGLTGAANGQDRSGKGYFMELRGATDGVPLDYRLRGERYTKHFRPRGGVVSADRRSAEMHAGWRFDSGVRLRARYQLFDDLFQTDGSEIQTRVGGANLSGPLLAAWAPDLSGQIDIHVQTREDPTGLIDAKTVNLAADFTQPLAGGWFGRLGLFAQDQNDRSALNLDNDTWQVAVSADHALTLGQWIGTISPGMLVRILRDGTPRSDEFQPTLGLRLGARAHSLGVNYGALVQDRLDTGSTDVHTHTVSADYRYTRNRHVFGAEVNFFGFNPDPGANTEAWNVGVYWTYEFDRPGARTAAAPHLRTSTGNIAAVDLLQITPGLELAATVQRLQELAVKGGAAQAGLEVYEYRALREIEQRQRLVLVHSAGQLDASAIVIDFDTTGGVDSLAQTFERVRKALIDRYGTPDLVLEEGEFTPNVVLDVNAQRLLRVAEWETEAGVLRFGIPRRLDGRVRMEIQHRTRFPPARDLRWSIEALR